MPAAIAHKQEHGTLAGLARAEAVTNEELVELPCDILAPCALEQVVTEVNADRVKATVICEGANGPVTPTADAILEDKGVLVLPDVLANAGGVVVSYFEWVQGLQEYFWREDEVNAKLHDIVARAFEEAWQTRESHATSLRMASYGLAVQRVAEATTTRGPLSVTRRVTVYHAADCGLCERALEIVESVRDQVGFDLEIVDIGGNAGARTSLPRAAARGRDRRRAGVHLLRRRGGAALAARSLTRRFPRRPREGRWQNRDALSQTIDRGTT